MKPREGRVRGERLGPLLVGALVAAFVAFPFWWWYALAVGHYDMAAPMDDPADAGPGERQAIRWAALTIWTAASLALLFGLLWLGVKKARERRARFRGDIPL
jgi:hypothetical protein